MYKIHCWVKGEWQKYELENFLIEAKVTAQLQHPGIVPIYEMNKDDDGQWFFTMREIGGSTLHPLIRKVNRLNTNGIWNETKDGWTVRRLISSLIQVCNTLHYAHSQGVIHRDIKPSNIMIGEYGEVLVVDWGIAKIESWNDSTALGVSVDASEEYIRKRVNSICGTPSYMAPEQINQSFDVHDARCDVYAIGIILYEILTGRKPYSGDFKEVFHKKCTSESPRIEDLLVNKTASEALIQRIKTIPQELMKICNRAIQKIPEQRYATTQCFAKDLQGWLDGAQRREKALQMLKEVQRIKEFRSQEVHRIISLKDSANKAFANKSNEGWELWRHSKAIDGGLTELDYEIEQILHQGMLYAPEMTRFHEELIILEHRDFSNAIIRGDKNGQDRCYRRIQMHLEHLPASESARWQQKLHRDVQSTNLLRRDHGELVGRTRELTTLMDLLSNNRLVSIVGSSGIGKTHLMLKCLHQIASVNDESPGFCALSHAVDSFCIAQQVMKAFELTLDSDQTWTQISESLKMSSKVIAFDNAEKTFEETKKIVELLVENTEDVTIILTSRVALDLPYERVLNLEPLSLTDGVELFIKKAQDTDADFELDDDKKDVVLQIVQHLNGLPMAIELASIKSSVLDLQGILDRTILLPENRFENSNNESLLCAIDWSWEFLPEPAKATLLQCSLFREGVSIELAENTVILSQFGAEGCLFDSIKLLVDRTLLIRERIGNQLRYRMPFSIVEYLHQKPSDPAVLQLIDLFKARLGQYLANYYEQARADERVRHLNLELENYLLAGIVSPSNLALQCCKATLDVFCVQGPISRAVSLLTMYLRREDIDDSDRQSAQDEVTNILQQVQSRLD